MDTHLLIGSLLSFGSFLLLITFTQLISNKFSFPYTVALLIIGFLANFLFKIFHIDHHLTLSPDLIYYILLPILLFEAALHINFHQFRLQFKTITFLATFGLMISLFVVGVIVSQLIGLPFEVALLFGAIISATDPIAVLALFKTLGAPRRLALVADGESMFNDATGVIVFRLIAAFVVANNNVATQTIISGVGGFLYVFIGSIIFGLMLGYIFSELVEEVKNNRVLVSTFITAIGIGAFVFSEHFLHLSGVITTVVAGLTIGNLGRTKITRKVNYFVHEFWEYLGFISLSLVFFFASFNMDLAVFARRPFDILVIIIAILLARAISVYLSIFITNNLTFFGDEPNIPLKWQHILNWGGLRGVIPLVLAYSLPDSFAYKDDLLAFTLLALVFTLLVNGLTIKTLLVKLGLHIRKREEQIIDEEMKIFDLEEAKNLLNKFSREEFDTKIINKIKKELNMREVYERRRLLELATKDEFLKSLKIQALKIERKSLQDLYDNYHINENVFRLFDASIDLQLDALEHPEVFSGRGYGEGGFTKRKTIAFRIRLHELRIRMRSLPLISGLIYSKERFVLDRYSLLRARVLTSKKVENYLKKMNLLITDTERKKCIDEVFAIHEKLVLSNKAEIKDIAQKYPLLVGKYQEQLMNRLILGKE